MCSLCLIQVKQSPGSGSWYVWRNCRGIGIIFRSSDVLFSNYTCDCVTVFLVELVVHKVEVCYILWVFSEPLTSSVLLLIVETGLCSHARI
jgi:hypothetical protein